MTTDQMTAKRECSLAGKCGACQTLNLTYERELSMKMKKEIALLGRYGHVEEILPSPMPTHYRNKVQYLFCRNGERVRYGLYRSSDGGIVHVDRCLMEDEGASAVCHTVRRMLDRYGVTVYDGRRGVLRHVMARRARSTGEIICALVTSGERFPRAVEFAAELAKRCPDIRSVSQIINDTDTPLWLGSKETVLYGDGYITDELCGCRFDISARAFYQINPTSTELLYRTAAELAELRETDDILDAYCGIGTVGIIAAKHGCRSLTGFDVNEDAIKNARENARRNGLPEARYFCGSDTAVTRELSGKHYDVVFADPPRAGCDKRFIDLLRRLSPERLVYISCDPETLARDLEQLKRSGYRVGRIQPVDMFPGTVHVETVCLLSKLQNRQHIEIELNMDELDVTDAEKKATYQEIKDYVLEHSGLTVSSLYIAQVKQKCGIIERENYNKPKSEDAKQPQCPPDKEKAIKEALQHFGMI